MATGNPKAKWTSEVPDTFMGDQVSGAVTLSYAGKATPEAILATPPATIQQVWRGSAETTNCLYYGDNLPVLSSLLQEPSVRGQVKLIYIDPPFATNSIFQSRTQNDAYQDLLVGAHFVEFLRKRIIMLRELLANDGSIYVHLDSNMAFHIKIIMDEVFGIQNFRSWITRRKCSNKNYTKKTYGNISDYLLFYSKSDQYIWNRPVEQWTTERAHKEYTYIEEKTGRRYKKVPIHAPGTRNGATGQPWRGVMPPPGKHWQYVPETLEQMDACGEIAWSATGNPRRKIYLDASDGVSVQDIWYDFRDTRNQNILTTGYPTEKNPDLLARIISASSNRGDLVLDSFSGSGTTLAVAGTLGRHWIGIDNSSEAIEATLRRLTWGAERMGDFVKRSSGQDESDQEMQLKLFHESASHSPLDDSTAKNFSLYAEAHKSVELVDGWSKLLTRWPPAP